MSETDNRKIELPIIADIDGEHDHPNVARELGHDVTIRARFTGVALYAVYDGETQVSQEVGPLNDENLMFWAEGYLEAKRITEAVNE